jgi:filamentous hemagglutinin
MTTVPYTFGNESSPIPLSQLDANFAVTPQYANTAGNVVGNVQANITSVGTLTALSVSGNIVGGNLNTAGSISTTGNVFARTINTIGNVFLGGTLSVFGTVAGSAFNTFGPVNAAGTITGGNLLTTGLISAGGNITSAGNLSASGDLTAGGNLSAGGNLTATGRISAQGNVTSQGIISATGNIVTAANFVGNFLGNITGNLSVGGSNTQVLFNNNGNVGAAGGLTYNSGSNTLGVLGVVSAQGNIYGANLVLSGTGNLDAGGNLNTAGNLNVGINLYVTGGTQLDGIATAPTATVGTFTNQVATTAFVNNQINQYANNVAITGGNISANRIGTDNWTLLEFTNVLYFQFGGSNVAKLDSSGNFTTIGNVTGFGTI